MIRIYPEHLFAQLRDGLYPCYFLSGTDPLLLQEAQDEIRSVARQQGFLEHFSVILDPATDWQNIFATCQEVSLFTNRQMLLLTLPENGPNAEMSEKLLILSTLLHHDVLLLLRSGKLTKAQENSSWYKALSANSVIVHCQTPEHAQLPRWLAMRAKKFKLMMDETTNQLLCYYYEGNLLALSQALERLTLLCPDGKLTLPHVEQAVNDAAHFKPFHWADALLGGQGKRALHILRQIRAEDNEPVIMLRVLQRDLLLLVTLRRQMIVTPLSVLFEQHHIWRNRRPLFSEALQRMESIHLMHAIRLLRHIELTLKQDYDQSIWLELETFSLVFCYPYVLTELYRV